MPIQFADRFSGSDGIITNNGNLEALVRIWSNHSYLILSLTLCSIECFTYLFHVLIKCYLRYMKDKLLHPIDVYVDVFGKYSVLLYQSLLLCCNIHRSSNIFSYPMFLPKHCIFDSLNLYIWMAFIWYSCNLSSVIKKTVRDLILGHADDQCKDFV